MGLLLKLGVGLRSIGLDDLTNPRVHGFTDSGKARAWPHCARMNLG